MTLFEFITAKRELQKAKKFTEDELKFLTRSDRNGSSDFYGGEIAFHYRITGFHLRFGLFLYFLISFSALIAILSAFIKFCHHQIDFCELFLSTTALTLAWYLGYDLIMGQFKKLYPKIDATSFSKFINSFNKAKLSRFLKALNKVLQEKYNFEMPRCLGVYILCYDKMKTKRSEKFLNFYMRKAGIKNADFQEIKNAVKAILKPAKKEQKSEISYDG